MGASTYRGRTMRAALGTVILACAIAAPGIARAQSDVDSARKDIQAMLDKDCQCMSNKDFDTYGKSFSTDYQRTDYLGDKFDRDKSLSQTKSMVEGAQDFHTTSTIEDIKMRGDNATVLVRTKGNAKTDFQGKLVPVTWDERDIQVWTKTPDGWRLKHNMGVTQAVTMNGKPYIRVTSDQVAAARTAIQSVYNALVRAAVDNNEDAAKEVIPAGFVSYPAGGGEPRNREQFLQKIRDEMFGAALGTADYVLGPLKLDGDRAVVVGELRVQRDDTVDGKPAKTTVTTWHRDVWERTADGKWRPVEFHPILRETETGGKIGEAIYSLSGTNG